MRSPSTTCVTSEFLEKNLPILVKELENEPLFKIVMGDTLQQNVITALVATLSNKDFSSEAAWNLRYLIRGNIIAKFYKADVLLPKSLEVLVHAIDTELCNII